MLFRSGYDRFTGVENVIGSWGNDNITGDDNANILIGRVGFDTLNGAGGADTLWSSGRGGTTMTGGTEADRFSFDARDDGGHVITDFAASQGDKIVLRGFGLTSGADAVSHVYTDATTHNAAFSMDGVTIYTNVQILSANDFLLA